MSFGFRGGYFAVESMGYPVNREAVQYSLPSSANSIATVRWDVNGGKLFYSPSQRPKIHPMASLKDCVATWRTIIAKSYGQVVPCVNRCRRMSQTQTEIAADLRESTETDRRSGNRKTRAAVDRRSGMDRRRGPGRRRGEVRKAAEEGEITGELLEFIMTIDEYKRINERPFPTWSEVFELIHYLGYRKVAPRADHINTASGSEALESSCGADVEPS